jgi:DNA primase
MMTESEVDYEPIVEILIDIFGNFKNHNEYSGQLSVDCPVCSYEIQGLDRGDNKGNLEINYIQGIYHCWSCGETHDTHGRLRYLVKKYGSPKQFKKFELLMPDEPGEIKKKNYKRVRLPAEYISFTTASQGMKMTPHYKKAYNYLKQRHVTDEMIKKYQIGFCYQGKYANRIIIPSYDSDEIINYFVARSIETRSYRKYDNPEAEKQIIIFNEYLINWDEPIQLVEGAFDSIFLPNAIPMLGKVLSDFLFEKLYEKAKKITIIMDGDAWANALKLYDKLNGGKLFGKIWITKLPIDKDIADVQGDLTLYPPFQFN